MGLSNISDEDLDNEKKSLDELFHCCDEFKSVIFNSGAGSGKTYSLIKCLKYILSSSREELLSHNQKIACITYTNVAAENIKQQIGASSIAEISTIHDRLWNIISNQQSALLIIHEEKLNEEIMSINDQLSSNKKYDKYKNLSEQDKANFFITITKYKKLYNKAYNLKAKEFREFLPDEIKLNYSDLLSNATNFKSLVDKLFRRKRFTDCLNNMKSGEKGFKAVCYDAMFNRDRLDKMRISHDTLLEYGYRLVEKYPKMRQLIIDQYPYILVDEYQDTADIVVKIMNIVNQYANEIHHNFFIAYFGDSVQNIYDKGVGKQLKNLHKGLFNIYKEYNRRSYSEIINVANNERNDEITQRSIYSD